MSTNCDTIMVGVCPCCRTTVQVIGSDCMPPAVGHEERTAGDGGKYWVRPLTATFTPVSDHAPVQGEVGR